MKEIVRYEAFDGTFFHTKEECETYEENHPFRDERSITFYSVNGKKVANPCESVYLDSNRFIAYTEEALLLYQHYCEKMGIKIPTAPALAVPYPLHYQFERGKWTCIEGRIAELQDSLTYNFLPEYEDEVAHGLPFDGVDL